MWNPAAHVELPTAVRTTAVVWTPAQLATFLDLHADHRHYALFHLIAVAGLRRGEALGLRWADVDLDQRLIRVQQQLLEAHGHLHFGPPKTSSGLRTVPLDDVTVSVLGEHREQQDREAARADVMQLWSDTGLVFTRHNGLCLRPDRITREFQGVVKEAGLPTIRLHDLRHTSASLALAAGVPLKVVSARLGHSSLSITADLYTHVIPAVAYDAADLIGGLVPGRRSNNRGQPDEPAP